jgi:hypothetical protein
MGPLVRWRLVIGVMSVLAGSRVGANDREAGSRGMVAVGLGRIGGFAVGKRENSGGVSPRTTTDTYGRVSFLGSGNAAWVSTPRIAVDVAASRAVTVGVCGGLTLLGSTNRWVAGGRVGYLALTGEHLWLWANAGTNLYRERWTDRRETTLTIALEPVLLLMVTPQVGISLSAIVEPTVVDAVTAASVPNYPIRTRRDELGMATGIVVWF